MKLDLFFCENIEDTQEILWKYCGNCGSKANDKHTREIRGQKRLNRKPAIIKDHDI